MSFLFCYREKSPLSSETIIFLHLIHKHVSEYKIPQLISSTENRRKIFQFKRLLKATKKVFLLMVMRHRARLFTGKRYLCLCPLTECEEIIKSILQHTYSEVCLLENEVLKQVQIYSSCNLSLVMHIAACPSH